MPQRDDDLLPHLSSTWTSMETLSSTTNTTPMLVTADEACSSGRSLEDDLVQPDEASSSGRSYLVHADVALEDKVRRMEAELCDCQLQMAAMQEKLKCAEHLLLEHTQRIVRNLGIVSLSTDSACLKLDELNPLGNGSFGVVLRAHIQTDVGDGTFAAKLAKVTGFS